MATGTVLLIFDRLHSLASLVWRVTTCTMQGCVGRVVYSLRTIVGVVGWHEHSVFVKVDRMVELYVACINEATIFVTLEFTHLVDAVGTSRLGVYPLF